MCNFPRSFLDPYLKYRGFMVSKQDPKEMYAKFSMATPLWKFDVTPMLSIDEIIEAAKAMQKKG